MKAMNETHESRIRRKPRKSGNDYPILFHIRGPRMWGES